MLTYKETRPLRDAGAAVMCAMRHPPSPSAIRHPLPATGAHPPVPAIATHHRGRASKLPLSRPAVEGFLLYG